MTNRSQPECADELIELVPRQGRESARHLTIDAFRRSLFALNYSCRIR